MIDLDVDLDARIVRQSRRESGVAVHFADERVPLLRAEMLGDETHELVGVTRLLRGLARDHACDRPHVDGEARRRPVDEWLVERASCACAAAWRTKMRAIGPTN
jgi:hypothetical protein